MSDNLFPRVRNAVGISLYCRQDGNESASPENSNESADSVSLTQDLTDSNVISFETSVHSTDSTTTRNGTDSISTSPVPDSVADDSVNIGSDSGSGLTGDDYFSRFAVKTNTLFYAILMPNIEFEYLINDHWSVSLEGDIAWWGSYKKEKSYRVAIADAEVRRWIKPRSPWHGFYVGLIAGGGYYDLENNNKGQYGHGFFAGPSVGYMWTLRRHLSLEAEVGFGYAFIHNKEYHPFEGHHVYDRTKDIHYYGPIKLKLSLVWRFMEAFKSKGSQHGK